MIAGECILQILETVPKLPHWTQMFAGQCFCVPVQYHNIYNNLISIIHYLNVKLNFALLEWPLVPMYIYLQTPVFEKFLKRERQ